MSYQSHVLASNMAKSPLDSHMTQITLIIMFLTFLNKIISFGAQLVIVSLYGASPETDAYFVAITLPSFFISWISTIGPTVLIPLFISTTVEQDKLEAWKIASIIIIIIIGPLTIGTGLGMWFAKPILRAVAPGLQAVQLNLAVDIFILSGPMVVMLSLNKIMMGLHNALERFVLPAASIILVSLGIISGAILLSPFCGIYALIIGQSLGSLAQLVIISKGIIGSKKLRFYFDLHHPALKIVFRMVTPLSLGGVCFLLLPTIEKYFASELPSGQITYLDVAYRIGSFFGPLFVSGLAPIIFTRLSNQVATQNYCGAYSSLSISIRICIVIGMPVIILSPQYAQPLVCIFFEHGRFAESDTLAVAPLVPFYLLAITSANFGILIGRGFHSLLHDTITPTLNTVVHLVIYIGYCILLIPLFGYIGLALASSLFWTFSTISAALLLRNRLDIKGGRKIIRAIVLSMGSALISYIAVANANSWINSSWAKLVVVSGGFLLYVILGWFVFKLNELQLITNKLIGIGTQNRHPER